MPSIEVSEPSVSKFVEKSIVLMPGDEKPVYVLIGTPPSPEQTFDGLLDGVAVAPDGYVATPAEPAARPAYFDGKFLAARDLMNEQASSSDTGFDLV
jgi:hypothetical protein